MRSQSEAARLQPQQSVTTQTIATRSVVVDTTASPYAKLHPVPVNAVKMQDTFWQPRRQLNREVVIPGQYRLCEETGRIDNLRRAAGKIKGEFQGWFFNDSDVYKMLEAAAWQLAAEPDAELDALVDRLIEEIGAAQQPDGYLNSYFMFERASQRWTNFDLHEMYCAGHLIQAAVAHYRGTGKTTLLNVAARFADHICNRFGPEEQGKVFGTDGHPEIEMAMVELYRATGERKYLEQAQYFVDVRGRERLSLRPFGHQTTAYHQDHMPFRQLSRLEGHAVRAVYLNCGGVDLVAETGEQALSDALHRMWDSMVTRQMYINGGLGSRYESEGFGRDYELPNARAHTETCASVASVMWNWRMLLLEADARYADVMELALYNSVLSGISLDGTTYFYQNPLSDDGGHRRQTWFAVACCPSNVLRLLASLPGYLYSTSDEGIWAHLYASSTANMALANGQMVTLMQRTDYPWSGDVALQTSGGTYSLFLRLPGWCGDGWTVTVNDQPMQHEMTPGRYVQIKRAWQAGDTVRLHLPMPVERVESHPSVTENQGRVALRRGPLLYCIEGVDHPDADVRYIGLPDSAQFTVEFAPDLLSGVNVLRSTGQMLEDDAAWQHQLYRTKSSAKNGRSQRTVPLTAIPYYAWANREASPMQVWIRAV